MPAHMHTHTLTILTLYFVKICWPEKMAFWKNLVSNILIYIHSQTLFHTVIMGIMGTMGIIGIMGIRKVLTKWWTSSLMGWEDSNWVHYWHFVYFLTLPKQYNRLAMPDPQRLD